MMEVPRVLKRGGVTRLVILCILLKMRLKGLLKLLVEFEYYIEVIKSLVINCWVKRVVFPQIVVIY